jgi:predicted MFS family arabinose efflux permease
MLLVAAVMGVVLGAALVQEADSRVLGLVVVLCGVALGVLLMTWLRRAREPLVSLASLGAPRLLAGSLGSFVNTAATSSTAVLLTLYLQRRHGFSAFEAGLTLLALSLAVVVGASAAPRLSRGHGPRRPAVLGLGSMGLGNLVVAVTTSAGAGMATGATLAGTIVGLLLLGAGLGLSSVAFNDIGTDLPEHEVATATGVLNTGAQLGTAIGVAALLLVAAPGTYGPIPAVSVAVLIAALLSATAARAVARWQLD